MDTIEIVLLIAGGMIFIFSFLIPSKKGEEGVENPKKTREEIKDLVRKEMEAVKSNVDEMVEEAVNDAMEKTERTLERLSNEKIMAVNEYSETVLADIHKNHEEAMFLYDMLNNKHTNLKNTVTEVNRTVKEAEKTVSAIQNMPVTAGRLTGLQILEAARKLEKEAAAQKQNTAARSVESRAARAERELAERVRQNGGGRTEQRISPSEPAKKDEDAGSGVKAGVAASADQSAMDGIDAGQAFAGGMAIGQSTAGGIDADPSIADGSVTDQGFTDTVVPDTVADTGSGIGEETQPDAALTAGQEFSDVNQMDAVFAAVQEIVPEAVQDVETENWQGLAETVLQGTEDGEKEVSQEQGRVIGNGEGGSRNKNDRVIELYRQGKSKVLIAKELGLGVGEVKLVIDLYNNQ